MASPVANGESQRFDLFLPLASFSSFQRKVRGGILYGDVKQGLNYPCPGVAVRIVRILGN